MLIFGYRHSQSALKRVQMKTISHLICKITYTFLYMQVLAYFSFNYSISCAKLLFWYTSDCLSLAYGLLIRSSAQATGFRFATALSAHGAPALRFTLAVWREGERGKKGAGNEQIGIWK